MYVALVGNPSDGYNIIGPFDFGGDAFESGDEYNINEQVWVMKLFLDHSNKWDNPLIQFARLISELQVVDAFTDDIMNALAEGMDLDWPDIIDLIARADAVFEESKNNV